MKILLATCEKYPDLSESDSLLRDELRRRGHEAEPVVWNGPDGDDAAASDLVVLRSTWDFHFEPDRYEAWLRLVDDDQGKLINPLPLVLWGLGKTYLLDLADKGAPVPRTALIEPGGSAPGWIDADRPVVIKPTVGASGAGVELVAPGELGGVLASHGRDGRAVIVQEFVEDTGGGEWALVFFDGEFSHGFQRVPVAGEFRVNAGFGGVTTPGEPPADLVALAGEVVDLLPLLPAYVRVDMTITADGPVLMEVEVNEPSICLHHHPDAPARFADAVLARASSTRSR